MPGTVKTYGLQKGLPKKVESICPECGKVLEAEYYDKDGKVYAKKTCPEHGEFDSLIWSDTKMYLEAEEYAVDGLGIQDPEDAEKAMSIKIGDRDVKLNTSTILANVDLTNRCNMTCPICFAEANSAGYVYEPDYETIVKMLEMLRSQKPTKCPAVQFSGGEPTIHPRFFDIIKKAKELGFSQIQFASNGLSFRDI
ncbi:MAG: radical SAM protein, partial [Candidatus Methanomethylophilaceae archaeon]|nr:radical SAM protein [Candidatus Methanomethylophilaceae archaeon]